MENDLPIHKFGNKLGVKMLAGQMWCEKQVEFKLLYGETEKQEMKVGKDRHRELHEQITKLTKVNPVTVEDSVAIVLHNMFFGLEQFGKIGMTREFHVYGKINNLLLGGMIDQLNFDGGFVLLSDHKTRTRDTPPSLQQIIVDEFQLKLYNKLLNEIKNRNFTDKDFFKFHDVKGHTISKGFAEDLKSKGLFIEPNIKKMADVVFSIVTELPPISKEMKITYEHQETKRQILAHKFIFDDKKFIRDFEFLEGYWLGKRKALFVGEDNLWKCNYCEFKSKCDLWTKNV